MALGAPPAESRARRGRREEGQQRGGHERAAAYLRLVQGLRGEGTEKLLSLPRASLALAFGAAVAALAPGLPVEA